MSTIGGPVVLSDTFTIPKAGEKTKTAALVVTFALLTALFAQFEFHIGWTPVPITGQTFAVLLAGAALGSRLGAASQLLYVVAGLFLPFYSGGAHGWSYVHGATGGYLVGMIVASFVVGLLAERKEDRNFITALPVMIFGSAVIYAFGVPWLAHAAHMSAQTAVTKGVAPFLIGDGLKSLVAGALIPVTWKFIK